MTRLASLLALCLTLLACTEGETWSTSPSDVLTFSSDTVSFDTIITERTSATQTLIAFNNNKRGLKISNVSLALGESSPFMVNVDGQYLYGGTGDDFEVFAQDSIYVRIAVTLPSADSDEITPYSDQLIFRLENGATQAVTLLAEGMDVIILRGETFCEDVTLDATRPYLVYDSLVVAHGATLTLPEGCTLMMHDGVSLHVHGTLLAEGTVSNPVTLRGDRTDRMFSYLPYDNTPNRWGGVHLYEDSRGNSLTQVDLHAADYGIIVDSTDVAISNSVIHNLGGTGLALNKATAIITGTQVSNTLGDCVSVEGGSVEFVHCTLAQFYPFSSARGSALTIGNRQSPLERAWFINCVITGYADDEIMGDIEDDEASPVDYLFLASLLRTVASNDSVRFRSCLYDIEDSLDITGKEHFVLFDTDNFLYDFTPDSLSPIRSLADRQWAEVYATDLRGRSRLADNAPDAGAYEGE